MSKMLTRDEARRMLRMSLSFRNYCASSRTKERRRGTFVLVGGGPAGVEMAGAIAVLVRKSLRTQFRRIDPMSARVVLIDMAAKVLGPFADDLSKGAKQRLEKLGVEIRLGHSVDRIDEDGVIVAGQRIASKKATGR